MIDSYGEWPGIRRCGTSLVSAAVEALRQVDEWPAENVAAGVVSDGEVVATQGEADRTFRWASVTKPATALAVLIAAEEGTVDLDEPAGPPGSTVRHLLAHTSGLPFEGTEPIAKPATRRIYSNAGFEVLAGFVGHQAEMPFADYLGQAAFEPLGMSATLEGSAGAGVRGSLDDLLRLGRELLDPTLVAPETLDEAITVQFPGLGGVIPGIGRYDPNDWGLGLELRDGKPSHWTGNRASVRTFGHFGGSGTFLWVDPDRRLALAVLTDFEFGQWALDAWPRLSDAVIGELASDGK
jgi:CubicO group peptidase (beta-lactamase class C family)